MNVNIQKQFVAVRAVIKKDDKYLVIRESSKYEEGTNVGKYDFPGGRLKAGETVFDVLEREVEEEVGMKVKVGKAFFVDEWRPVIKGEQVQIIGIFFMCEPLSNEVRLSQDHDDYKWLSADEYLDFPLNEAISKVFQTLSDMV